MERKIRTFSAYKKTYRRFSTPKGAQTKKSETPMTLTTAPTTSFHVTF